MYFFFFQSLHLSFSLSGIYMLVFAMLPLGKSPTNTTAIVRTFGSHSAYLAFSECSPCCLLPERTRCGNLSTEEPEMVASAQALAVTDNRSREHKALSTLCLPNPGKHHDAVSFHVAAQSFALVDRSFELHSCVLRDRLWPCL